MGRPLFEFTQIQEEGRRMAFGQDFDLRQLVQMNCSFGPQEIAKINRSIASKYANFRIFRDAVNELESREEEQSPAGMVRLGVFLYLLGKYRRSLNVLQHGDGGALAHFYMAKAQFALKNYEEAEKEYTCARQAGYCADDCVLGIVEVKRCAGQVQEALGLLDDLSGSVQQTAEYLYQRGITALASGGTSDEVGTWFSRAVDTDPMHPGALFGLALESDRRGNDDDALELYKRAAAQFPSHVGSLINLGLMYEDRNENELAVQCYERRYDASFSFDALDELITEEKKRGVHRFLCVGGEPLRHRRELIAAANKHSCCTFWVLTGGKLIDERFAKDLLRTGNVIPLLTGECLDGNQAAEILHTFRVLFGMVVQSQRAMEDQDKAVKRGAKEVLLVTDPYALGSSAPPQGRTVRQGWEDDPDLTLPVRLWQREKEIGQEPRLILEEARHLVIDSLGIARVVDTSGKGSRFAHILRLREIAPA